MQKCKNAKERAQSQVYLSYAERRSISMMKSKCKGESAESSLLELCRATQHFDDEIKMQSGDLFALAAEKSFTPDRCLPLLSCHEKQTAWHGGKIFITMRKTARKKTENHVSNKNLQISENNPLFILLLQNKGVSLQRCSGQQNNNH